MRLATKVQTLIRDLEKLKIAKQALKMDITTRNNMRAIVEPVELENVVRSKKKIGKEGQYRSGGKAKQLTARQLDMYKEKYQQSGGVQDSLFQQNTQPLWTQQGTNYTQYQNSPPPTNPPIQFTNPTGYVHPQTLGNQGTIGPPPAGTQAAVPPVTTQATAATTTKKKKGSSHNKKVKGYILQPDGTIIPNTGTELILDYKLIKDTDPSSPYYGDMVPDISSFKGVIIDKQGNITFDATPSGKAAQEIYNQAGHDNFAAAYAEETNNSGQKAVSFDELYKFTDAEGLTDQYLIKQGKDKKHGREHDALIGAINSAGLGESFSEYIEQGAPDDYTGQIALPPLEPEYEQTEEEILAPPENWTAPPAEGDESNAALQALLQDKMTGGEKLGLATGALGRLGGLAAAWYNRPRGSYNAFQGVGDRAEDSMQEAVQGSRKGIEQTDSQIKAQGNLARQVARDTSNSWAQRYAASLGAQRITDEGLIKNRNMWERLYGDLKGKQAQIQLRGDAMEAQGAMQVQDWEQRDRDAFATSMAQEAQNLTNFGASYAGLRNMQKLRQQQLAILGSMGQYFDLEEIGKDSGTYGPVFSKLLKSMAAAKKKKKKGP